MEQYKREVVHSRQNQHIVYFRLLLRERKKRWESGQFVAEGSKVCEEALRACLMPQQALFSVSAVQKYTALYKKTCEICTVMVIDDALSLYLSDTKAPQGVFFLLPCLDKMINMDKIFNSRRMIIADTLQDAGNLGTIIRSCDAFGVDALILSENCCDLYAPKVVRSAAGSLFRLPICIVDLESWLPQLKENGFFLYAARLDKQAKQIQTLQFPQKAAVVMGNEGNGVSQTVLALCAESVYIPISHAESLNVGVAAGIVIWEFMNRGNG